MRVKKAFLARGDTATNIELSNWNSIGSFDVLLEICANAKPYAIVC